MTTHNEGSNGDKKRPADDVDPEISLLRAFAQTGFPAWVQRIPGDYLAKRVAEVSITCQRAGHNLPELTQKMAALLQSDISPDRVLDLVVAWEDVTRSAYDPALATFVPHVEPQQSGSAPQQGALHDLSALQQEVRDLKDKLKKESRGKSKEKPLHYKDRPITPDVIAEFKEESGVAEWMHELADLINKEVAEDILDSPAVPVAHLWKLLVTTHHAYAKKYGRYKKSPSRSSKRRSHKSRSRSSKKRHASRRRRKGSSTSESGSSGSSSSSEEEFYWRGKYKFIMRDGVEFLVTSAGREFRTDRRPPGECDRCGGRHWEWLCKRSK